MAKRKIQATELNGFTIYQNTKKGTIWYDIFTRKGYIITSQEAGIYMVYTSVLPIAIIVAVFAYNTFDFLNVNAAIILGVVLYIAGLVGFRLFYFYRLPEAKNWERPKTNIIDTLVEKYSKLRLQLLLIISLLIIAAGIFAIFYDKLEGSAAIAMAVMSLIAAAISIISAIAIARKSKEQKNI